MAFGYLPAITADETPNDEYFTSTTPYQAYHAGSAVSRLEICGLLLTPGYIWRSLNAELPRH